ncbi:MAG: hypothetical protein CL785_00285 [Chloroflexi bacterium]|nr:hypothetical protein [Chloroflexota bacterium]|tara:strand:+ start:6904 stop:7743 length:840 start_codon:yes stop_codon:yes gene_type:complete
MKSYIASVNGTLLYEHESTVSILDRGFTLADGVFETMVAKNTNVFRLDQHLQRLKKGSELLGIVIPKIEELKNQLISVLDANKLPYSVIRFTVSRGYDYQRGLNVHADTLPTIVIRVSPRNKPNIAGISVSLSSIRRNEGSPVSKIKSLSYVDGVIAKQLAHDMGFDDAILLNNAGYIACATSSNVFLVKNKCLITPSLSNGVLEGVTRSIVLESAKSIGLNVYEESVLPDFNTVNEMFMTNIVSGIVPIVSVDGVFIGSGSIGPISNQLFNIYIEMNY